MGRAGEGKGRSKPSAPPRSEPSPDAPPASSTSSVGSLTGFAAGVDGVDATRSTAARKRGWIGDSGMFSSTLPVAFARPFPFPTTTLRSSSSSSSASAASCCWLRRMTPGVLSFLGSAPWRIRASIWTLERDGRVLVETRGADRVFLVVVTFFGAPGMRRG